jgi:hypothetical protein
MAKTTGPDIASQPVEEAGAPTPEEVPMTVRSLSEALDLLGSHTSRKVANNTWLTVRENSVQVVLHQTAVVTWSHDGIMRLDAGGWYTKVTAERINDFTPLDMRLWSDKGRWMVGTGLTWDEIRPTSFPFADGILLQRLWPTGEFVAYNGLSSNDQRMQDAHNARVKSLLPKFLAVIKKVALSDDLHVPTSTCAMCYPGGNMLTDDRRILGDVMEDRQHLMDHLIERDPTRELIRAAFRDKGWPDSRAERSDYTRINSALRDFMLQRLIVGCVATKHGKRPLGEPSHVMVQMRRNAEKVK